MAKRAIALAIGNSTYPGQELKNPVNDATDFSSKLKRLGFVVKTLTNITVEQLDSAIDQFGDDLKSYDVGLFFFAGHGLQINGENYVTATNTNFHSESSVKFSAVNLNKVLSLMESSKNSTNIVILDACRDNPYERAWNRSINQSGLAPMYAPKGTLIAYATSPGQRASDGTGNNGLYTSALLAHIEDENIPIEELFKRVRNTVSAFSSGKQTSWEHTSLTGTFHFNSGQIISAVAAPYSEKAVSDKQYIQTGATPAEKIIGELKRYSWGYQNTAIDNLGTINPNNENPDTLFVLGRNILQAACGGSFSAENLIADIVNRLKPYTVKGENHLLNGILFEIYFNSEGKFRYDKLKICHIDQIFKIQNDKEFEPSIKFIQEQLKPFSDHIFVLPNIPPMTISFDIITEKTLEDEYKVRSIRWEGNEILHKDTTDSFFGEGEYFETMRYAGLKSKTSSLLSIPQNQITFNSNDNLDDMTPVYFPLGRKLKKQ